jgi:DUF4097 and DUF4098 domain-containing protein YvlB
MLWRALPCRGLVERDPVAGLVELATVAGSVELATVAGSVELATVTGLVELATVAGSVELAPGRAQGQPVQAGTQTAGPVTARSMSLGAAGRTPSRSPR